MAVFAKNFSNSATLDYTINWCSVSDEVYNKGYDSKCETIKNLKFNHELDKGRLTIGAAQSIHTVKHQSVNCGTVELSLFDGPELLSRSVIDTGTRCTNVNALGGANLFNSNTSENSSADILNDVYCKFHKCEGEDGAEERSKKASNPPTVTPGEPPPESGGQGGNGSVLPEPPKPGAKFVLSCPNDKSAFVGTLWTRVNGYGHCDERYNANSVLYQNCRGGRDKIWGTAFGIDVHGDYGQNLFLPSIDGKTVQWNHYNETPSSTSPGQSIHRYTTNYGGEKISLQYHHSQVSSQPPVGATIPSGSIGTLVCKNCSLNPSHVHVQLKFGSTVTSSNSQGWVDAGKYFNCPGL